MNESENTTYQNLWDTATKVLRGKFITLNVHIRKEEKSQINDGSSYIKNLEKEKKINPKQEGSK